MVTFGPHALFLLGVIVGPSMRALPPPRRRPPPRGGLLSHVPLVP
jgi:hypothetical protein